MIYNLSFNRWAEPTRVVDSHDIARVAIERWSQTPGSSPESLIAEVEKTINGLLRCLCDA